MTERLIFLHVVFVRSRSTIEEQENATYVSQ